MVYEPQEDSFLVEKHVQKYALGKVLDMGTGSGILAIAAAKNKNVREVVAVDVDGEVIQEFPQNKKINVLKSDLFENVKGMFDFIMFNPPYLPQDYINKEKIIDPALYGGDKGYEIVVKFLNQVSNYLTTGGKILLLFSSLTNKKVVDETIIKNLYTFKEIDHLKISFETLYVYLIEKNEIRKDLEKSNLKEINYFSKGKRGLIYQGFWERNNLSRERKKVAIKIKNPESKAFEKISNEAYWLKKVSFGPKVYFQNNNYLVMEFIEGTLIKNYVKEHSQDELKILFKKILQQCLELDNIKINKKEMTNPYKHIIVKEGQPYWLDFERASYSDKPKNVTQFLEYAGKIFNKDYSNFAKNYRLTGKLEKFSF
jgi:release factor glutamine methyltransferase